MKEAGVLIDTDGRAIYWHLPHDRSMGALPDSRNLWDVIWENRDRISGYAHSHPGSGTPGPSYEDVTTFAAIEAALGCRLQWWITSSDTLVLVSWAGPEKLSYKGSTCRAEPEWVGALRDASNYKT